MASTTDVSARPSGRKQPFARLRGPARAAARRQRHVGFWLAVGWLALIVLLAVFANLLPIKGYATPDFTAINQSPGLRWPEFLGTDSLGRSELSRLIYGARVSLAVGFLSVGIAFAVGTTLGVLAGYFRRVTEAIINVFSDTLLAIPPLVLLLGITVVLKPSLRNLVIGLAVLGTPTFARLAKANTMSLARRELLAKQEFAQLMAVPQEIDPRIAAGAAEIAQRFMGLIGDPHRSQVTAAQQARQLERIAAIILDPLARFLRHQTGRHDDARRPHPCETPLQTVATRSGFIAT